MTGDGPSWELVLSALVGGMIALALKVLGEIALDIYKNWNSRKTENAQIEMLKTMLDPEVMANIPNADGGTGVKWRTFETLRSVIGADEQTTKRLLIKIGARGSTKDGRNWALRKDQPLDPREARDKTMAFKKDL